MKFSLGHCFVAQFDGISNLHYTLNHIQVAFLSLLELSVQDTSKSRDFTVYNTGRLSLTSCNFHLTCYSNCIYQCHKVNIITPVDCSMINEYQVSASYCLERVMCQYYSCMELYSTSTTVGSHMHMVLCMYRFYMLILIFKLLYASIQLHY